MKLHYTYSEYPADVYEFATDIYSCSFYLHTGIKIFDWEPANWVENYCKPEHRVRK